jgi:SAM-dependent methyltransferase
VHVPDLHFNSPVSPERWQSFRDALELSSTDVVLDVGCGRGEMLADVVERWGCRGIGIDPKEAEVRLARERLGELEARVVLHVATIDEVDLSGRVADAALCVGATHAFGPPGETLPRALDALLRLVRPGGRIVIGEGTWQRDPPEEYLAATGMGPGDHVSHAGNVQVIEDLGCEVLLAEECSRDEWDAFERMFWDDAESAASERPGDPSAIADRGHWRRWRRAYEQWGRDTLGFGLYLLRAPEDGPGAR